MQSSSLHSVDDLQASPPTPPTMCSNLLPLPTCNSISAIACPSRPTSHAGCSGRGACRIVQALLHFRGIAQGQLQVKGASIKPRRRGAGSFIRHNERLKVKIYSSVAITTRMRFLGLTDSHDEHGQCVG